MEVLAQRREPSPGAISRDVGPGSGGPEAVLDCGAVSSMSRVDHSGGRVGVFGGTFDPPHVGHLVTAVNVRHGLGLDEVLMVVANEPWQKVGTRPLSPVEDRLAMVLAATRDLDGVRASDVEVRHGGPSYTADTLARLDHERPGTSWFTVLGADAAAGIETWERAEEVARRSTLVVVDRPGVVVDLPAGFDWCRIEVPHLEVSSTDLRARVRDGRPLDFLVPPAVLEVIRDRGLYR